MLLGQSPKVASMDHVALMPRPANPQEKCWGRPTGGAGKCVGSLSSHTCTREINLGELMAAKRDSGSGKRISQAVRRQSWEWDRETSPTKASEAVQRQSLKRASVTLKGTKWSEDKAWNRLVGRSVVTLKMPRGPKTTLAV
jgi:hypothetical protein